MNCLISGRSSSAAICAASRDSAIVEVAMGYIPWSRSPEVGASRGPHVFTYRFILSGGYDKTAFCKSRREGFLKRLLEHFSGVRLNSDQAVERLASPPA